MRKKMQKEIWKDIPNYEGCYKASDLGRIKSLKYGKEKILKQYSCVSGYFRINLSKNNNTKTFEVHKLIAIAFLNHKPCGFKIVVDHINDIKADNRVVNLQLVSQRFNAFKTQGRYSSVYKGVCYHKPSNKWLAYIRINNIRKHLGLFEYEYDAHLAYQNKLKEIKI